MEKKYLTLDSQVHSYERDHIKRPWIGYLEGPDEVTGDDMITAMDNVGVDGAILVSSFNKYGFDPSYAIEVFNKHPTKYRLIKPFDTQSESIRYDVNSWAKTPGVVGARLFLNGNNSYQPDDLGVNELLSECGKADLPVNIMASGSLSLFQELAKRHPNTRLVLDHLGMIQPHIPPVPSNPFQDLDRVLSIAEFDNVAIKISGACTLSNQSFPFPDIWKPLEKIFSAYGLDRCLWGTDWTRAVRLLTYKEAVDAFRLTDQLTKSEKSIIMGKSVMEIYKWNLNSL